MNFDQIITALKNKGSYIAASPKRKDFEYSTPYFYFLVINPSRKGYACEDGPVFQEEFDEIMRRCPLVLKNRKYVYEPEKKAPRAKPAAEKASPFRKQLLNTFSDDELSMLLNIAWHAYQDGEFIDDNVNVDDAYKVYDTKFKRFAKKFLRK